MNKETIAKALFEAEFSEDKVTWDTANDGYKELFTEYAEAVIKALEAEIEAVKKAERLNAARLMVRYKHKEIPASEVMAWLDINDFAFKELIRK